MAMNLPTTVKCEFNFKENHITRPEIFTSISIRESFSRFPNIATMYFNDGNKIFIFEKNTLIYTHFYVRFNNDKPVNREGIYLIKK